MKTPEQLKGTIRSMAAKRNLRAQEVLQMFLFERILERLAKSKYKKNFIESEDKFVDGTYHSDENLLNNISTLNKHGA